MMKFSRYPTKAWAWLLLAAGLAACTGATEPAEPTSLPLEKETVQPGPTEPSAGTAATESLAATSTAPMATEVSTDTPSTPTPLPDLALPDLGPAPDFTNEVWLNTEAPLTLETLRGKVVLVEFWTFG